MVAQQGEAPSFPFLFNSHTSQLDYSPYISQTLKMESDLTPSNHGGRIMSGSPSQSSLFTRDGGATAPAPTRHGADPTAVMSADDLARLHQLQLGDATPSTSTSCTGLNNSTHQVNVPRQSSIHQYFTPLNRSPEPPFLFADTPAAVNQTLGPRPVLDTRPSPTSPKRLYFAQHTSIHGFDQTDEDNIRLLKDLDSKNYGSDDDCDVTIDLSRPRPEGRNTYSGTVNHIDSSQRLPLTTTETTKTNTMTARVMDNSPETSKQLRDTNLVSNPDTSTEQMQNSLPQRDIRSRRERMAASSPPPPDPDFNKLKESLENIRQFEESLFWDDPNKTQYIPDSYLYPETSNDSLWLTQAQSNDHAKRMLIKAKLSRLSVNRTHTVSIPPRTHIDPQPKNIHPNLGQDQKSIISYFDRSSSPQMSNNNTLDKNLITSQKSTYEPIRINFSIDERTDTHERSAFVPQATRTEPALTFMSSDHTDQRPRPLDMPNTTFSHSVTPVAQPTFYNMLDDQSTQPPGRQVFYAEILPDAFDLWKNFRNASQREAACRIRAGYLRHLARAGRFPPWAAGMMPPPGLVTTIDASIKIVSHRKLQAISSLNLVASILEDKASAHKTNVETYREGLKRQYSQYTTPPGSTITYSYQVAVELAGKLVDRQNLDLNKKLNQESDELKAAPDAALWTGIPNSFRPHPNIASVPQAMNTADNALYSDIVQVNTTRRPTDVNPVSPLTIMDQARSSANPNQIFQATWVPPGPQRGNRGTGRRRPYNQGPSRQSSVPPPQQPTTSYNYQNRRRPCRGGQNQPQQNRGNELLGILRQIVDQF